MIKNFTKAMVKGLVGQPFVFQKRNGSLAKAEVGADGAVAFVNYGVKGQYKQSSLSTYNDDLTSNKVNSKGNGGSFDITAIYKLSYGYDAGDLATALIDGDADDVLDICDLYWKRDVTVTLTMAEIAAKFGADHIVIKG